MSNIITTVTAAAMFALASITPAFATLEEPREIAWADLLPEGETVAVPPDPYGPNFHEGGPAEQIMSSETVAELDGQSIRMPGFMLPLDYTERGKVASFLLVPYFGACIHVPPPPPNQIVYVTTKGDPVESRGLWDPVYVTGTMQVKMNINGLGDAAYTLVLDEIEPYRRRT